MGKSQGSGKEQSVATARRLVDTLKLRSVSLQFDLASKPKTP